MTQAGAEGIMEERCLLAVPPQLLLLSFLTQPGIAFPMVALPTVV